MKCGVIDIGSNSVRLMLWANGKTIFKRINVTRLGEGLATSGTLSETAIERTAKAVAAFYSEARKQGAEQIFAFATAAVRKAQNGCDFCNRVSNLCPLKVDIVSGDEEALLGLKGALQNRDGGMIDIGGASTEICFQKNGERVFAVSLDVGAVRLYDLCKDEKNRLYDEISKHLSSLNPPVFGTVYAVGGTATTLASVLLKLPAYSPERIQDYPMTAKEISALADKLLLLTCEERKALDGMDVERADIIGGGALLLSELMNKLNISRILTSDADNLEGYLAVRGIV